MDTKDLESYQTGYEEHCAKAKVPFEDYTKLENKIDIYKKAFNEIEELLNDSEQYSLRDQVKFSKAILAEMEEELEKC